MILTNIADLRSAFKTAKDNNKDLAIEITLPGRNTTEIIIVKNENLDYKLEYYNDNYTEDLRLKGVGQIKMLQAKTINFEL